MTCACRILLVLCALAAACSRSRTERSPARVAGQHAAPAAPGELRFAVIGDYGTGGADEMEVARLVASWNPAFIVTTGDNNHPDGAAADLESHVGAAYAAFIPGDHGAFGRGPEQPRFFPALGNHDWRSSTGLQPYIDYFRTPGNGRYYEVLLGDGRVQLDALDSDPHEPDGVDASSAQAAWLRARKTAPGVCLRIVAFHHPPFSSAVHGPSKWMQWPFRAMGIDAVLAGHEHVYEHLQIDGIPYLTNGLGGAELYDFPSSDPHSLVRYNQGHGALLITVAPEETRYELWSVAGEKVDAFAVPRHCELSAAPKVGTPTKSPGAP